jgi:hypothetical protein
VVGSTWRLELYLVRKKTGARGGGRRKTVRKQIQYERQTQVEMTTGDSQKLAGSLLRAQRERVKGPDSVLGGTKP